MRHNKYKVVLRGHTTEVRAFNERESTILAQAEAIINARDYEFVSIEELNPFFAKISR